MNIMELGAIGELVGGVAVIASLLYVGFQIRQNTVTTRAASHQAITDAFNSWNLNLANEAERTQIWLRGHQGLEHLSDEEQFRYSLIALSMFRVYETLFYQSQVGTGDRRLLDAEESSLREAFTNRGLREWWQGNPYSLDREFRRYIDTYLEPISAPAVGEA